MKRNEIFSGFKIESHHNWFLCNFKYCSHSFGFGSVFCPSDTWDLPPLGLFCNPCKLITLEGVPPEVLDDVDNCNVGVGLEVDTIFSCVDLFWIDLGPEVFIAELFIYKDFFSAWKLTSSFSSADPSDDGFAYAVNCYIGLYGLISGDRTSSSLMSPSSSSSSSLSSSFFSSSFLSSSFLSSRS